MKKTLMTLALLLGATAAQADIYVVVNTANPVAELSRKDVIDIFMGRKRAFPGGEYAMPLDQRRDGQVRERFYRALTGMSLSQVNGYWSRLVFTGQTMPPQPLTDDSDVREVVRKNAGAIGYLDHAPTDPSLKVVLQLKEP